MIDGKAVIEIPDDVQPVIDPDKWITMAEPGAGAE